MKTKKHNLKVVFGVCYLLVICVSLFILFWMRISKEYESTAVPFPKGYREWTDLECEMISDENAPVGVRKIYTGIPDVQERDDCIAFYVVHQYVEVYFGDELQCAYIPDQGLNLGKTLGSNWIMVNLSQWEEGEEVRIEITPVYDNFVERQVDFLLGVRMEIIADVLKEDFTQISVSALAIIVGCIFVAIAIYGYIKDKQDMGLSMLGLFSVCVGLWRITDTHSSPFIFAVSPKLLFYISLLSLMVGIVPVMKYVHSKLYGSYKRIINMSFILYFAVTFVQLLLQLLHLADLRESLLITHILAFTEALICIGLLLYDEIKYHKQKTLKRGVGLFLICVAGATFDIVAFYVKGNSSGLMFTLVAFVIYVVCVGVLNILDYIEWGKKCKEQEAELAKNRIAIMISQIQPHFLYNTLNSIYYLCEKEPKQAQQAIDRFATYLRGNLDALKSENVIAFSKELEHVEIYLSLEKMRFEEDLNIEYDIRVKDFAIPSLTVQPLIENAVKYGIGKKDGGGKIMIRSLETDDGFEVSIEDDGVGFEPDKISADGRNHIGIDNVRRRLWELCQASLDIKSEPGKGTCVKITIPKDGKV